MPANGAPEPPDGAELPPAAPGSGFGTGALTLVISAVILYLARDIFVPLALAALLSFVLSPPMLWLRHHGFGRAPAVLGVVALAFVLTLGFGSVVVGEIASLTKELPVYEPNIAAKLQSVRETIPVGRLFQNGSHLLQELRSELAPSGAPAMPNANTSPNNQAPVPVVVQQQTGIFVLLQEYVGPVLKPLAVAGLVLIFVIFFLFDRENLRDRFIRLAGGRDLHRTTQMLTDAVERLSRYLWTEFIVNTIYGLLMGIGLFFIGVPNAALWGAMFLVLRFVPYIGTWIAAAFPVLLSLATAPGWTAFFETFGLFITVELTVSQAVEPLWFGASAGMSPVAVIVAATFWTWLWGPIGLVLSTPLTACLVVIGRYAPPLRFIAVLFGNEPPLAVEDSFYQRLLAGDAAEAAEQAESFLKDGSLADFCDQVALPALLKAQEDHERGVLTRHSRAQIFETIRDMIETIADGERPESADRGAAECLGARNELDDAAALLLAQLLIERRIAARTVPARHWLTEPRTSRGSAAEPAPSVYCLSHLGDASPQRLRLLARRLRRYTGLEGRLLLGAWSTAALPLDAARDMDHPTAMIASSFAEAARRVAEGDAKLPGDDSEAPGLVTAAEHTD